MVKFGVSIWLDLAISTALDYAKLVDKHRFDSLWFPDHYFLKDTFAVQAMAAAVTSKVVLGTAVTSPFLRHPVALASGVASIYEVSNRRAVYGIGAGGYEFPAELYTPLDRPATACREAIDIARALWRGDAPVTYSGKVFKVKNVSLRYKAPRDIPVYLAARGPKMLNLSGEIANGVITHGITDSVTKYCLDKIAEGARRTGADPKKIDYASLTTILVTNQPEETKELLKPGMVMMVGGEYSQELIPHYGLSMDEVAPIREMVRKGDFASAAKMITSKMIDAFLIVGTKAECLEKIDHLIKLGVTHFMTNIPQVKGVDAKKFIRDVADLASHFKR